MALLESIQIPLGTHISPFTLKDPEGTVHTSDRLFGSKGLLVAFTCNHCPYAVAVWPRFIRLSHGAKELCINTVAINPNIHPNYPEDAPEKMTQKIKEWRIPFPYLVDESQEVARTFKAQCTPDIYLFNSHKQLVYHGRIDDSWKDESLVTQEDLKIAITQLANEEKISAKQMPSMGCSIKWRN